MSGGKAVVVDHGIGNLRNVVRALVAAGAEVDPSSDPNVVAAADRLVLPGVGAFRGCMDEMRSRGQLDAVLEFVRAERPLLGICVGMQILFEVGEEFGETPGLGLLPGRVRALPATRSDGTAHKIPHIGWSALVPASGSLWAGTILDGVEPGTAAYFLHSFEGVPTNPADRLADCDYGGRPVCAAVRRGDIHGCQFHPEKSGPAGIAILRRFLNLVP